MDDAGRRGVRLKTGANMHLICLGNKGDWPYLVLGPINWLYMFYLSPLNGHHLQLTLTEIMLESALVRQPVPTFADHTGMFPKREVPDDHVVEYAIFAWQAAQALTMKMCVWVW